VGSTRDLGACHDDITAITFFIAKPQKNANYHFVVAKPSKKVTKVVVSFFFATMEPRKKTVAHCHQLFSCSNTKTKGCHRLLHYTTTKKKKKATLPLSPSKL